MLKCKARRRIATKAAAAGVVSAGLLLGLGPLLSSATADTKTVNYICKPWLAGVEGTDIDYDVTVALNSSVTAATIATGFNATVALSGTALPPAPVALETTNSIQIAAEIEIKGNGSAAAIATVTPSASVAPAAPISVGGALPALPTPTATITPSTGTTQLILTAKNFTIRLMSGTTEAAKFVCSLPTTAPLPTPASATLSVTGASTTPSTSQTPSPSPSTSNTPTPRTTKTVTETATAEVPVDDQVETPDGGVATGGGGMLGPDGRVFVLTGTAIVLAAGIGGLMLRSRRRPQQG
ncbi:hypothetical protein FDA94_04015 [Herbidospora galbida]|uniref:LPXTG cell wall anchor domain-containing protein n=1 Tax=Herbidospora galbida TaxID=2575442 RepID=A0A4U3MPB1_9ACTN|nr:hypothetical protein [Herbidospora galbida]TKK90930.1 hypothetical protein FDA94_04015 [Herbidospora galbida]